MSNALPSPGSSQAVPNVGRSVEQVRVTLESLGWTATTAGDTESFGAGGGMNLIKCTHLGLLKLFYAKVSCSTKANITFG